MIEVVKGDMIKLAQEGQFDVIGHGCNCFCKMKRGIAPLMAQAFKCDDSELYKWENPYYTGDMNKLGNIEYQSRNREIGRQLKVVNMYTQYHWNDPGPDGIPLDYNAITLCLRKMNYKFKELSIALPGLIGCGLAGGDSLKVWNIIAKELKDCKVSIVFIDETKIPSWLDQSL